MKIDKVIFTCSVEYSPFWNVQSRVYAQGLGIEPICLLFGKKSDTDMSEKFGQVVEIAPVPGLPLLLQILWSKFHQPLFDQDKVWMIGDIDLVPLQRAHFIDNIADAPSDALLHLNADTRFFTTGGRRLAKDKGHVEGVDLPAHYFVGKGSIFHLFGQNRSVIDQLIHIVQSDRYGCGPLDGAARGAPNYYACAEEHYGSELVTKAMATGLKLLPYYYNNGHNTQRIDASGWNGSDYTFDKAKLADGKFVDIHCLRPYGVQKDALAKVISQSPLSSCG